MEAMDEAGEVGEAAIQLFRDHLLLDTEIRIEGHIEDLRKAVEASASGSGSDAGPEVRRYVRRWRRGRDSTSIT